MANDSKRRLGRPPASSSADTRDRILREARRCFADLGYEATTNRELADRAGITTGAIYHYFDSKLQIYVEVHRDVNRLVGRRFVEAANEADSFVGKVEAILDCSHDLNRDDPSLARFLAAVRTDVARHPELGEALGPTVNVRSGGLLDTVVDHGISTGELRAGDRTAVLALLHTVLVGLTDAVSGDLGEQRAAIDGIAALLDGTLIRTVDDPHPA